MGRACGTCGGRGEVPAGLWCGNLKERGYLEDLDLDARIISKINLQEVGLGHGLA